MNKKIHFCGLYPLWRTFIHSSVFFSDCQKQPDSLLYLNLLGNFITWYCKVLYTQYNIIAYIPISNCISRKLLIIIIGIQTCLKVSQVLINNAIYRVYNKYHDFCFYSRYIQVIRVCKVEQIKKILIVIYVAHATYLLYFLC